jgi:hypothetical protein
MTPEGDFMEVAFSDEAGSMRETDNEAGRTSRPESAVRSTVRPLQKYVS